MAFHNYLKNRYMARKKPKFKIIQQQHINFIEKLLLKQKTRDYCIDKKLILIR